MYSLRLETRDHLGCVCIVRQHHYSVECTDGGCIQPVGIGDDTEPCEVWDSERQGRPQITADSIPAIFFRHYPAFKNGQLNVSELARVCDISRTTVYKYIGLLEA